MAVLLLSVHFYAWAFVRLLPGSHIIRSPYILYDEMMLYCCVPYLARVSVSVRVLLALALRAHATKRLHSSSACPSRRAYISSRTYICLFASAGSAQAQYSPLSI